MLVSNRVGFDPNGIFFTGPAIHCPVFKENVNQKIYFAILNSKLFWFFICKTSTALRGNAFRLTPEFLKNFGFPPIKKIDEAKITTIVDQILSLKQNNNTADTSALEGEIDNIVYKLYGLTDDEIAIVENS